MACALDEQVPVMATKEKPLEPVAVHLTHGLIAKL